ncbi:UNVERIFIED_CONTAM: hypothetical protein RMT77_009333 [Armadillidium vulgare]
MSNVLILLMLLLFLSNCNRRITMYKVFIKISLYFLFCTIVSAFFTFTSSRKQSNIEKSLSENDLQSHSSLNENVTFPIVINTWTFIEAGRKAWEVLSHGGSALDAIEQGCSKCEELQCDGTVGYGGSPDENGETTLDAMIMDGESHDIGAVGALRGVRNAISVARAIMERTSHTFLVGSQATRFALSMGFLQQNLTTEHSADMYYSWKNNSCQPNFWRNVHPNPSTTCGPYFPSLNVGSDVTVEKRSNIINEYNHDTIGMIAIDSSGRMAGGTSTNGARHKIPGRVGDSPIPGSGAYVDKNVGGAAATGDGDVMMRFLPSLIAVEGMRRGLSPDDSSAEALQRIIEYYPRFSGAVIALNINGQYGAACHNLEDNVFNFTVGYQTIGAHIESVTCIEKAKEQ